MRRQKNKKNILTLYLFLFVFQPPLFSISLIYISGCIVLLYYVCRHNGCFSDEILGRSGIASFYSWILLMFCYFTAVTAINVLYRPYLVFSNRARCFNQLVILTGFEMLFAWFVIDKTKRYHFGFHELLECLGYAGALQGVCAIAAYAFPPVRDFFMRHQEGITSSWYDNLVRGYGFSGMMLDLFGYGMGLLAGVALLNRRMRFGPRLIMTGLCMVAIVLNARTGFVVAGCKKSWLSDYLAYSWLNSFGWRIFLHFSRTDSSASA